ncbi:MAG: acetyl-CoA carboxylase biotin carboxyl carrier protein subunit [Proteobacteria bacterium]|nr:acetyl-CoA carboxylase biotin carboxyl carrier protein subunit [Pseudomonadota bacterium]
MAIARDDGGGSECGARETALVVGGPRVRGGEQSQEGGADDAGVGPPTAASPPVATPAAAPPAPAAPAPAAGGSGSVAAPIPGVVTSVLVKAGDTVAAGQIVLKLEAMKMENDIATPAAGTVKAVHVSQGSEVSSGQLLVEVG